MVAESQLPEVFDGWRYEANGGRDNFAKRHHGHCLIKSCPAISTYAAVLDRECLVW
jgi:hypothetical protein